MRKICNKSNCNQLATLNGYCDEHQFVFIEYQKKRAAFRFNGVRTKSAEWNHLYRTSRWIQLREEILERDGRVCSKCGNKNNLIVHHLLPWKNEYEFFQNHFAIECKSCHSKGHQKIKL